MVRADVSGVAGPAWIQPRRRRLCISRGSPVDSDNRGALSNGSRWRSNFVDPADDITRGHRVALFLEIYSETRKRLLRPPPAFADSSGRRFRLDGPVPVLPV